MIFQFSAEIQRRLATGELAQVFTKSGEPIGLVRDALTGRFVKHARGITELNPLITGSRFVLDGNPLTTFPNTLINGWNAYQSGKILEQGRQTLQAVNALAQSVSILQATTAIIGVGVAATAALAAVNLYQTLKLRRDVATLRLEVKDGFIELKQALQDQGLEIIQHIDRVAEDVEFRHHRTILARAYGLFNQAIVRLQSALTVQDLACRNADINSARDMMFQALADYDNPQLLHDVNAAAYIRRRECVWAIHQAIALTYQLQGEQGSASQRLETLCTTIRRDSLTAINQINSQAELDFLFPELVRIHNHDLQALNLWQAQTDWVQTLSAEEIGVLCSSELEPINLELPDSDQLIEVPPEQALYEELQPKSNDVTLCNQLRLMMAPEMRLEYAAMIGQKAQSRGLKALTADGLQAASDYTIANLHYYFQIEQGVLAGVS
ncbi:hypothetical protein ACN4EK_13305 [Pantanalinema rosaneae CENA516]|uniref:hypothetical protein n=1 Tax=Pantanalinema rosaneae TaxID=1620701 RepID=UPI003D6FDD85